MYDNSSSRVILISLFIVIGICCIGINANVEDVEILTAKLFFNNNAELGEGSIWDCNKQLLYYLDIEGKKLYVFDPSRMIQHSFNLPNRPGTVVPRANAKDGEVVIAIQGLGVVSFNYLTGEQTVLANPETSSTNRYNDGKVDPRGRFWVGSMSLKNGFPAEAALYCVGINHQFSTVLSNVRISNGIVWSADATKMYYIDTPTQGVDSFDYNVETGAVTNRKKIINIEYGSPDGMTIDNQGMLWVAHYDGGRVTRWDPNTGKLLMVIMLPVNKVTSCAFGDSDLSMLYITTARDSAPGSGGLYRISLQSRGIRGVSAFAYKG
ncbi:hypothetical protein SAMD00019534_119540 [Acytostelium subglobosum LB1]|uniref:hypothetical protein n=1 Tax=Acytostelium subglobosum LB1 TaxID=1410327 RepID=UPI0006448EEB|nr:hypothetical protein SAMD00019534_119540 [Acytostelium subglobosum LB1]GAM28778.1 hypothetical protein SAMD00019534_119540 [Acytostelium subglobosum LB1]|eukprot:XP_012748333.1 hypothetical protein SAMD00019534_119540 [Acytostelium subglobosum LB1]